MARLFRLFFSSEHIAYVRRTRWDFGHARRNIVNTMNMLFTALRGTLLTKHAAHTSATSWANRHAWLLAQLIALVCGVLKAVGMDVTNSGACKRSLSYISLHESYFALCDNTSFVSDIRATRQTILFWIRYQSLK